MATITIDSFGGIAPRVHPTLLGENMAVRAHNCLLKSGKLVPIRQPKKVTDMPLRFENGLSEVGDAKTLYLWRHRGGTPEVLLWPGRVTVAESNLSSDSLSRIFVSGETGIGGSGADGNHACVYMRSANGDGILRHDLVKDILPAPVVSLSQGEPSDENNIRYTAFFQTWVDEYGFESGVSAPSEELTYTDGDTVVFGYCQAPAGAALRRIYKVVAGSESENVQFVFEEKAIGSGFQQIAVRVLDEDAGEVIPLLQSPMADLEMIVKVPGNFYAGVRRSNPREVRFSEVGNPSIWPDEYTASVGDDIVGLAVTLNTVFAITKGCQWAITGSEPEAMTASILASPQGCVSADSICVYDGVVFYASADGICVLRDSATTASLLTEKHFSRRDWQKMKPESCRMLGHDGSLFCWFLDREVTMGLAISLQDETSVAVSTHDEVARGAFVDVEGDALYFVRGTEE